MDEKLIIDATERFLRGEMNPEEMQLFRDLRKSRPDIDRLVVEYSLFLTELDKYGEARNFRSELAQIEKELMEKGLLDKGEMKEKNGRLIPLRFRKAVSVAAAVTGIVVLLAITIISAINSGSERKIKPLVEKLNQQERKTRLIEKKVDQLATGKPGAMNAPMEAKFRATGFIVDPVNGYIVTNAHVVKEARNRIIVENSKGIEFNAKAVYYDPRTDIAIVKISDSQYSRMPAIPYSIKKNTADLGEAIYLLGYPKQEIVYDEGYISAMNGYEMDSLFYQLSTPANEGNSGSPILNRRGELLGVISSMQTNSQGVVFAIKSRNIHEAVEAARKNEFSGDIEIRSKNILKGLDRPAQIRKMQDYIFMIKGN